MKKDKITPEKITFCYYIKYYNPNCKLSINELLTLPKETLLFIFDNKEIYVTKEKFIEEKQSNDYGGRTTDDWNNHSDDTTDVKSYQLFSGDTTDSDSDESSDD